LPSHLSVAAGATSVSFAIQAGNTDTEQNVTLSAGWHGQTPVTKVIQVKPHSITLDLPTPVFVRALASVAFDVTATHSAGFAATVSPQSLPSGSDFRGSRFTWTPSEEQVGEYPILFRAVDSTGLTGSATSRVVVRDAQPTIQGLFNPAGYTPIESCSPNAIVTFLGSGFSLHDPIEATATPWPTELAGVRIRINGVYAPITFVSDTTIHFQCPVLESGVGLEIVMEYESSSSLSPDAKGASAVVSTAPVVVRMSDTTPGIYQMQGTQAAALIAGAGMLAGPFSAGEPGVRLPARAVTPGEYLEIYANGMGATTETLGPGQSAPLDRLVHVVGSVTVIVGDGQRVPADFAGLTPGSVGLFQVNVRVPPGTQAGDAVPLYLEIAQEDGSVSRSNTVTIAISR